MVQRRFHEPPIRTNAFGLGLALIKIPPNPKKNHQPIWRFLQAQVRYVVYESTRTACLPIPNSPAPKSSLSTQSQGKFRPCPSQLHRQNRPSGGFLSASACLPYPLLWWVEWSGFRLGPNLRRAGWQVPQNAFCQLWMNLSKKKSRSSSTMPNGSTGTLFHAFARACP